MCVLPQYLIIYSAPFGTTFTLYKEIAHTLQTEEFLIFFRHKALHGLEGIYRDGYPVGYLRRADFGFSVNKTICYGYVRHPDNDVVTNHWLKSGAYSVDAMGQMFPASLHLKPVFDPKNLRVKGIYE